jgi:probable phosphoglycerate mutase
MFGRRGDPDVTEVLLIRHAQMPESNAWQDMPLTETGEAQAALLAGYLARNLPLAAVYTSPLLRTRQTAAPIAAAQGLALEVIDGLREVESYLPAGVSLRDHLGEEAWRKLQDELVRERRWEVRGGLGESGAALRMRAMAAVETAVSRHRGERIALVSHGPVINALVASVTGSPLDMLFQPRLTSISLLLAHDGGYSLSVLNATPHFETL